MTLLITITCQIPLFPISFSRKLSEPHNITHNIFALLIVPTEYLTLPPLNSISISLLYPKFIKTEGLAR